MTAGHLVVGAGPVGTAVASLLASRDIPVRLVSRRGLGPDHPLVERVPADAADADRLRTLAAGSAVVYNCLNPPYHRWPQDWPPMAHALLAAAESAGAVLATVSNLYVYGPVDGPMTPDLPLAAPGPKAKVRAEMWRDALAAHEAGRVRVTEVRGSDYLTTGRNSHLGDLVVVEQAQSSASPHLDESKGLRQLRECGKNRGAPGNLVGLSAAGPQHRQNAIGVSARPCQASLRILDGNSVPTQGTEEQVRLALAELHALQQPEDGAVLGDGQCQLLVNRRRAPRRHSRPPAVQIRGPTHRCLQNVYCSRRLSSSSAYSSPRIGAAALLSNARGYRVMSSVSSSPFRSIRSHVTLAPSSSSANAIP